MNISLSNETFWREWLSTWNKEEVNLTQQARQTEAFPNNEIWKTGHKRAQILTEWYRTNLGKVKEHFENNDNNNYMQLEEI